MPVTSFNISCSSYRHASTPCPWDSGARRLHHLAQAGAVAVDIGAGLGLGRAHQQRIAEFGEVSGQIEPTEDAAVAQALEHRRHRTVELQHRLMEVRT